MYQNQSQELKQPFLRNLFGKHPISLVFTNVSRGNVHCQPLIILFLKQYCLYTILNVRHNIPYVCYSPSSRGLIYSSMCINWWSDPRTISNTYFVTYYIYR